MTINLFLETPERCSPGNDGILHRIQHDELMIFVKYYDPISMKLSYVGHLFVAKTSSVYSILERAKRMAGLAPEEEIIGFEEVRHKPTILCLAFLPDSTPQADKITNGAIIIIQKRVNISQFAFPFVREFLEHVQNA